MAKTAEKNSARRFNSWTEAVTILETYKVKQLRELVKCQDVNTNGVSASKLSKKSLVWALAESYFPRESAPTKLVTKKKTAKKKVAEKIVVCGVAYTETADQPTGLTDAEKYLQNKKAKKKVSKKKAAKKILAAVAEKPADPGFMDQLAAAAEARAEAKSQPKGRNRRPGWRAWANFIQALMDAGPDGLTIDELTAVEVADLKNEGCEKTHEQVKGGIRWRPTDLGILLRIFGIGDVVQDGKKYAIVLDDKKSSDALLAITRLRKDDVLRVCHNAKFEVVGHGRHFKENK